MQWKGLNGIKETETKKVLSFQAPLVSYMPKFQGGENAYGIPGYFDSALWRRKNVQLMECTLHYCRTRFFFSLKKQRAVRNSVLISIQDGDFRSVR